MEREPELWEEGPAGWYSCGAGIQGDAASEVVAAAAPAEVPGPWRHASFPTPGLVKRR